MFRKFKMCLVGWLVIVVPHLHAGDWPQILGPNRNGTADNETLPASWNESAPREHWRIEAGQGFSGPAVVGQRAILFHRVDDSERVEALDVKSGKRIWSVGFPARYRGGINPDNGPRCVPVIHKDSVYLFGAGGDLHGVRLRDGGKKWSRRVTEDFNAQEGYFGFGSTPMVADGKLLVNVGGRDRSGIVAFDLETGKTLWRATDERASYSSPVSMRLNDKTWVVFVTRMNTVAIDPATGKTGFQFPFGQRGPTVNAAVPLVVGDHLFVTSSYGVGAKWVHIKGPETQTLWENNRIMSSQYSSSVFHDGYLYGIHGREDVGVASYQCVEAKTGKLQWTEEGFGTAHTILAGGKLLILKLNGELLLAEPSPAGFKTRSRARIAKSTTRSLPALSNGRLFVRVNGEGAGALKCVSVE